MKKNCIDAFVGIKKEWNMNACRQNFDALEATWHYRELWLDVIFDNESKEGESGEGNVDGEEEIVMEELVVSHSKKGKPSFVFHNPHQ
jgi:hypothetical protein